MVCHKCNQEGVKNQVLNKEFWYCRSCKIEIMPQESPSGDDWAKLPLGTPDYGYWDMSAPPPAGGSYVWDPATRTWYPLTQVKPGFTLEVV